LGFGGRDLATLCWAHAPLRLPDDALLSEALQRRPELRMRDLAAVSWSAAPLRADHLLAPLAAACSARSQREAPLLLAAAACGGPEAAAGAALPWLQAGWAFAFTGALAAPLQRALEGPLRSLGRALDAAGRKREQAPEDGPAQPAGQQAEARASAAPPPWRRAAGGVLPRVVQRLPGVAVVHKPPNWEVDASSASQGRPASHRAATRSAVALKLSAFLQSTFSIAEAPVVHSGHLEFGLLHRLDAPSSGLVLVALSYEALLLLRWQRDTIAIERDYAILCHGHVPPELASIQAPLIKRGGTSEVHESGQVAHTRVKVLGHYFAPPAANGSCDATVRPPRRVSLVVVRLVTGRQHQIRAHFRYVGHPVVCDGRYAQDVFDEDQAWCPRNFIHRWRLGFRDVGGRAREAHDPLPEDLREALAGLRPGCAASAAAAGPWLRGAAPASWGALAGLPERPAGEQDARGGLQ
ncbi:unnamed protein product, partial [Prorocentrum cordatum]